MTKELSEVIEEISRSHSHNEDEDDDVKTPEWRGRGKHVFILSDSGKPVYSRLFMLLIISVVRLYYFSVIPSATVEWSIKVHSQIYVFLSHYMARFHMVGL